MKIQNKFSQPSIYYEESPEGLTNGFPFMNIEKGKNAPAVLFIASVYDSEELVEGTSDETVKDVFIQSYYSSTLLKDRLDEDTFNKVRESLGLK